MEELTYTLTGDKTVKPIDIGGIFEITGFREEETHSGGRCYCCRSDPDHYDYDTGINIVVPKGYYFTIEGNNDINIIKSFVTSDENIYIRSKCGGSQESAVLVPHKIVMFTKTELKE